MNTLFKYLILILLLSSCGNTTSKPTVKNSAVVTVLDGMDKPDSVKYTCDSCEKYIRTPELLNKIIEQATTDAKESLKNPLSFIPRSIKINITSRDSFYHYYNTNKLVDSCVLIDIEYKSIGKNAYGTESEVKSESLMFLVGDSIYKKFLAEIRKTPLGTMDNGRLVDRELNLYEIDEDGGFNILPMLTKPYALVVTSTISCIDKGARLHIMFDDESEFTISSWNDFNCKGTAYFNLTPSMLELLKTKKVSDISFYSDKLQFAKVPDNESEYLMQYVNLISK